MPRLPAEFRRTLLTLVSSVVGGALAGAIAGWSVSLTLGESTTALFPDNRIPASATSTPTEPEVTVIPLDRRPLPPLVPSPFAERRSSSVASVYRRDRTGTGEGLLTDDRLVSQAVAITSDGWFAIPLSALGTLRPADLIIWHEGSAALATRAVLDRLSGVVFIKTPLTSLHAPPFARASDVSVGLAAWLERRAGRFEPVGIAALGESLASLDGVSSETAARRGVVTGLTAIGDLGAPIWSSNGALIGLVVSAPGEAVMYLPSSAWSSSLDSLLATGEIRHAFLGVRNVDLAWARMDATLQGALPERGALLREDRRTKKPAVERLSPAAAAGLRAGDVIQKVDRDILDGSADLGELLAEYLPASVVTLTVLRGTATVEFPLTLGTIVTSEDLK